MWLVQRVACAIERLRLHPATPKAGVNTIADTQAVFSAAMSKSDRVRKNSADTAATPPPPPAVARNATDGQSKSSPSAEAAFIAPRCYTMVLGSPSASRGQREGQPFLAATSRLPRDQRFATGGRVVAGGAGDAGDRRGGKEGRDEGVRGEGAQGRGGDEPNGESGRKGRGERENVGQEKQKEDLISAPRQDSSTRTTRETANIQPRAFFAKSTQVGCV